MVKTAWILRRVLVAWGDPPRHRLILLFWEFFPLALADGFSFKSEWYQVSSSLLDSSLYSGRFYWCCSLDCLHPFSYSQVIQSLYQFFCDWTERVYYNWYHSHFHVLQFFPFSSHVKVLISYFALIHFYTVVHYLTGSLLSFWLSRGQPVWLGLLDPFVSQVMLVSWILDSA